MQYTKSAPTREEIEERAYHIYLGRGAKEASAIDDWLAAEEQLKREYERPLHEKTALASAHRGVS